MNETKLPIWRTVWNSWRDLWRIIWAMPAFTATYSLLITGSGLLAMLLAPDKAETFFSGERAGQIALMVLCSLLSAPFCIAFYRYLLLGEIARRYELNIFVPRLRVFFGYNTALTFAFWLVVDVLPYMAGAGSFASVAALVVGLVVMLLPVLLFPAIAVDAPEISLAKALLDIRPVRALVTGFIVILACLLVTFISGFAFMILYALSTGEPWTPDSIHTVSISIVIVFWLLCSMTTLAMSVHFYRAWAQRLGRPAGLVNSV